MQVIHCGFKMVKFSPAGQIKRRQKHVNSTKNSGICEMRLECRHLLDEQDDCCMSYNGRKCTIFVPLLVVFDLQWYNCINILLLLRLVDDNFSKNWTWTRATCIDKKLKYLFEYQFIFFDKHIFVNILLFIYVCHINISIYLYFGYEHVSIHTFSVTI